MTAEDGAAVLEIAERKLPDIVLMDVVMPNLNGFQATRTLSRDGRHQHIHHRSHHQGQESSTACGCAKAQGLPESRYRETKLTKVIERIFSTTEATPTSAA